VSTSLEDWKGVPTALASDASGRFGAMDGGIVALTGLPLLGWAATIEIVPGDSATIHRALTDVRPGSVLVVDAGGGRNRAVWGGVLTAAARAAGVTGVVVDGAVRDVAAMRAQGFPVFARGASPAGPHKAGGGRAGTRISCGGIAVEAGDLVLGDEDGVVVVPAGELERARQAVRDREEVERRWLERIEAGESSASILGLTDA
jgi:regulator of RNase E activity RraA